MILRKCDRCGKLYEDHSNDSSFDKDHLGVATIAWESFTDYAIYDTYDLCGNCVDEFLDFMDAYAEIREEDTDGSHS